MKASLEFDLPREKEEFEVALNGKFYEKILNELEIGFKLREENEQFSAKQILDIIKETRGNL